MVTKAERLYAVLHSYNLELNFLQYRVKALSQDMECLLKEVEEWMPQEDTREHKTMVDTAPLIDCDNWTGNTTIENDSD